MSSDPLTLRKIRHEVRSVVEPLETVELLFKLKRFDEGLRIQAGVLEQLKKLVTDLDMTHETSQGHAPVGSNHE